MILRLMVLVVVAQSLLPHEEYGESNASVTSQADGKERDSLPASTSSVKGTVLLKGRIPKRRPVSKKLQAGIQRASADDLLMDDIVTDPDGRLQWAFVYVKSKVDGGQRKIARAPAQMEYNDYRLRPHVLGIRLGQDVLFRNGDPDRHTVQLGANAPPGETTLQGQESAKLGFVLTEPKVMAEVRCDIHSWERAWVGLLDHDFFSVTGPDGAFEIKGLPPGEYVLEAWHERCEPVSMRVLVPAKEALPTFTMEVTK